MAEEKEFLKINFKKAIETKYGKLIKGFINREELIKQLQELEGKYVNFILGYSDKFEKHYMKIDTWKPDKKEDESIVKFGDKEIPF